jgi:hypothetical protein
MTLGHRPREEGGHVGVKLSLNKKSYMILRDAKRNGRVMSKVVEDALLSGPPCQVAEATVLPAIDPQIDRLQRIMQQQPLKHTYLNDPRISFTIEPTGSVNYKLGVFDSFRGSEASIQNQKRVI